MKRLLQVLAVAGLVLLAHGLYVPVKAAAAQVLLEAAWQRARAGSARTRPWPWADTRPAARLSVPSRAVDLVVLAGASGRTLAFGPGHMAGSAAPGEPGVTVIAGHRDTHFRFLGELLVGEMIWLQRTDGRRIGYRVSEREIADARNGRLVLETGAPVLALVTCYPFDALAAGGPLRYVVTAIALQR